MLMLCRTASRMAAGLAAGTLLAFATLPANAQERLPWLRGDTEQRPLDPPVERIEPYGSSAPRAGQPDYSAPRAYEPPPVATYPERRSFDQPAIAPRDDAYRPPARYGASVPPPPAQYEQPTDDRYDPPARQTSASSRYEPGPRYDDRPHRHRGDGTFSMQEIVSTGHGFFGSISQGLASVIEHAFKTQGRPNGYILGQDVGGALVAGLRYGEGRLHTRDAGSRPVYWQGPSIGYDAGAEGSKVMVLVYNLRSVSQIYQRFGGVAGSAYVVGGVGLTYQTRDDVVLAPIRAGVGLRLGANVGYLKYTRRPTWNPF